MNKIENTPLPRKIMKNTTRKLLSGISYSALVISFSTAILPTAEAANYLVSSEAEFIAAINSINSDADPDGTITLTDNVTISDTATIPVATKEVTIDTAGGRTLTINAAMSKSDNLVKTGSGDLIFTGVTTLNGRLFQNDGTIIFKDGAQHSTPGSNRFILASEANDTANLIVSGPGTVVETGFGSLYSSGSNSTTLIRVEDGATLDSPIIIGISSDTVSSGGFVTVEVVGQNSLFSMGRLSSGLRGQVSYSLLDGGRIESRQADIGGNLVNVGLGDSLLISGAGSAWVASGYIQIHEGQLSVLDGGELTATDFRIALSGSRTVDAIVSGASSTISTTTGNVDIGRLDGDGTLTVAEGGLVSSNGGAGDIVLADGAASTGTLNIGGRVGEAPVAAGIINAANIVLSTGASTVNFNHSSSGYTFGPVMTGDGTVNHTGTGSTTLTGLNTYTGNTHVQNGTLGAGTAGAFSAVSDYFTVAGGTLALNGFDQTLASLDNAGLVRIGGAPGNTLTITGNYVGNGGTVNISSALGDDTSTTDLLHVAGDTSGTSSLRITNVGGAGAQTVEGIKVVLVDGASGGTFELQGDYIFNGEQSVIGGAYAYTLQQNGIATPADGDWYLRSSLRPASSSLSGPIYQPGVPLYEVYAQSLFALNELPTLRQRAGSRLWSDGSMEGSARAYIDPAGNKKSPFWGRMEVSYVSATASNSTTINDYDIGIWKARSGIEGRLYQDDEGLLIGGMTGMFGFAKNDVQSDYGNGRINTTSGGVGGTLTWYDRTGFYVDGQAHVIYTNSNFKSDLVDQSMASNVDGFGFANSIETGKRISDNGPWTLTPQAQLVYSIVHSDFTDNFGADVSIDRNDNLTGRLGLSLDYEQSWQDANDQTVRVNAYGITNLYYDFLEGQSVSVSGNSFTMGTEQFAAGIGFGGTYNWNNDNYSIYGETLVKTSFNNMTSVGGNIGFRIHF